MPEMHKFIDLSRRFRDLTDAELEEPDILATFGENEYFSADGWPELLKYPRVLLLAEAGSGKTIEMNEAAKRLASEGRYAFFVALESLDTGNLSDLLSVEEEGAFEKWKRDGCSTAWFFLDAVDELKLTQGKLERALNRFSKAVNGLLDRAHIVISCRPNDWRPNLDMATVQEKLPITLAQHKATSSADEVFLAALRQEEGIRQPDEDAPDVRRVRTVVMLPMNERQIEKFSIGLGVEDATAFIAEIEAQNAWIFARRPLDCSELVGIWRETGRLGTRAQQHEVNAKGKLKDDPDRADSGVLPDVKARNGAERLALALALTRTRTIQSPEQSSEFERAEGALNPSDILRDWTEDERKALLRRALFDPATYGRIRFHHRSVQEYLAACHLKSLRDAGMPVKTLMRFLYAERYGVDVVIPSMQAIAAWLALWNEDVRRELIEREPETLLSQGDPETLPLEARARLVRAFATAYGHGGWRGIRIPIDEVRRLARPELAETIRDVWGSGPANDDVRELLLELIWQGAIKECADIAEIAANDVELPPHHRIIAVRALMVCNRPSAVREIAESVLTEQVKWPDRVIHGLVLDLFPDIITVGELITLIERTPEPKRSTSGFAWGLRQTVQIIDPLSDTAVSLRDELGALIWRSRASKQEFSQVSSQHAYIAPALALLCERQLASETLGCRDPKLIWACAIANRFGEGEIGVGESGKLKQYFSDDVEIRETVFWAEVEFMDELTPAKNAWGQLYHAEHGSIIGHIAEIDRGWLKKALADTAVSQRRAVALQALIQLWLQRGRLEAEVDQLHKYVADDRNLIEEVNKLTAPLKPDFQRDKMERDRRRRQLVREGRERQRLDGWVKWREELVADPEAAFSPDNRANTVSNLYKWLNAHEGQNSLYNVWNLDALTQAFGSDVALRAVEAFQEAWRTEVPALWSSRPPAERNSTPWIWIYGLCGIAAESKSIGWAEKLTPQEAQVATAYATVELNGFPSWLVDLVEAHPGEVDTVLGAELVNELDVSVEYQHLPVLQDLTHADKKVKQLLSPHLVVVLSKWNGEFEDGEAGQYSSHHLDQVITIIDKGCNDEDRAAVASECEFRFTKNPGGRLALTWLRGLFRFEPERGVQAVESGLAAVDEPEREEQAIRTFAALYGDRDSEFLGIKDPSARAIALGRLVRCAYNYVRQDDDVEHEGGYTPNTRDDAETARNYLMSSLLDTPGPEARNVILELAIEPLFEHIPDRLRLLARQRAASDAEFDPFSPTDLATLEVRLEAPPHDKEGLFGVMMDRLDDLCHDITHDDFTDRRTLRTIKEEVEMQRTLARRLREMARGAYTITREDEVADQKRTDIRLSTVLGDQKAAIEIKLADKRWSLTQLERALRNQLVGQYLRHQDSKVGCLLLTYDGTKSFWRHPDTQGRLSFPEMVGYLEGIAKKIEHDMEHDVRLAVCGLDLTDPVLAPAHH